MSSVVSSSRARKYAKIGIAKANTASTAAFDISAEIAADQAKFASLNTNLGITYSGNTVSGNVTNDRIGALETTEHTHSNKGVLDTIAAVEVGTTTSRPSNPAVGQMYFDTTLAVDGQPIWYNGISWVDYSGITV